MAITTDYNKWVKLAAWLATTMAFMLLVLKLYAWLATGASAMLATATDSLLDLFASLMNLIILRFALQPPDEKHKFGHGKAESLAGLVQSAFVMGSAVLLIVTGFERTLHPKAITAPEIGIGVTILTIVMTLLLVVVQKWVIRKTNSVAISADALHYQSDLLLNLGVLAALILSQGYWLVADGIFTMLVGALLLMGAIKIIWLSVNHLMDHELPKIDADMVRQVVEDHPEALGLHELRTRQAGNTKFIQFHLELPDHLSLKQAHTIGNAIEAEINDKFDACEVLIHHDPQSVVAKELADKEKL